MLAHRNDRFFAEALASIEKQTFRDFETVIVANGPEANAITSTAAGFKLAHTRGVLAPLGSIAELANLGIKESRGQLICRFDSDDLCVPDRLALQAKFMNDHPEVHALGGQAVIIDHVGSKVGRLSRPLTSESIKRQLPFRCPMIQPSMIIRKSVLEEAGGYKVGSNAEDWELWNRLVFKHQKTIENLPDILIAYRAHSNQTTGRRLNQFNGEIKVLLSGILDFYDWRFIPGFLLRLLMAALPVGVLSALRRIFGKWQSSKISGGAN